MTAPLTSSQVCLEHLLPAGREKLRLHEVSRILSADDGKPSVSIQSIRNAMQEGRLFGNRIAFSAPVGKEQRIRVEWMARSDVLQALLLTRTASPADRLAQLCQIGARLPDESLDQLLHFLNARRAMKKPPTRHSSTAAVRAQ